MYENKKKYLKNQNTIVFLSLLFLFLSFLIVVFKCLFSSSWTFYYSFFMSTFYSTAFTVETYFLLAPAYSLPEPGIEVDLRSMFFLGAHCGNWALGS